MGRPAAVQGDAAPLPVRGEGDLRGDALGAADNAVGVIAISGLAIPGVNLYGGVTFGNVLAFSGYHSKDAIVATSMAYSRLNPTHFLLFFVPLVTAGLDTIALRMPVGFAADVIAEIGRPLAAPSANSSGRISGTTAEAVERDLGDRIGLIVDGGPTPVGLESTIVKVDGARVRLLRPGGTPAEAIEAVAGARLERGGNAGSRAGPNAGIVAPGMLLSHYAPKAAVRLDAGDVRPGETLLAFGPERVKGAEKAAACLNLSPSGDLREAAANLFTYMHRLDATGAAIMAVEPIPRSGLGEAINDRLRRAAAPRDMPARDMPLSRS